MVIPVAMHLHMKSKWGHGDNDPPTAHQVVVSCQIHGVVFLPRRKEFLVSFAYKAVWAVEPVCTQWPFMEVISFVELSIHRIRGGRAKSAILDSDD
jgi:hypothetical protein